jgi:transposase
MAAAAGRLPALGDRLLVLHPLGTAAADLPPARCPAGADPHRRWPRSRSQRRADGLPGRQGRRHRQRGHPRLRRVQTINGRKRFITTATLGLLLAVVVLPARVQDRDGAKKLLLELHHRQHPLLSTARLRTRYLFADGGFAGALVDWAATTLRTTIEIVRKPVGQKGFAVIPRRWVVERTLAWLTGYRRLARDYERHTATSEAIIRWASIATMARRIARCVPVTRSACRRFGVAT